MPQQWYVCLDASCEDESGGQRAFLRFSEAWRHQEDQGHAFMKRTPRLFNDLTVFLEDWNL